MWLVDRIMRQRPNTHPEQWATDGANEPRPSACAYSWSEYLMSIGNSERENIVVSRCALELRP